MGEKRAEGGGGGDREREKKNRKKKKLNEPQTWNVERSNCWQWVKHRMLYFDLLKASQREPTVGQDRTMW